MRSFRFLALPVVMSCLLFLPPVCTGKELSSGNPRNLSGSWVSDGKAWRITHNPPDGTVTVLVPIKHLPGRHHEFRGHVKGDTLVATCRPTDPAVLNPRLPERVRRQDIGRPPTWTISLKLAGEGRIEGTMETQHLHWNRKTFKITKVEPRVKRVVLRSEKPVLGTKSPPEGEHWAGRFGDERALVGSIIREIEHTAFGQMPRGRAITRKLWEYYYSAVWDFTFVVTTDRVVRSGGTTRRIPDTPSEGPRPGDARYVRDTRTFGLGVGPRTVGEEIYIGVDGSTQGLEEARRHPGDYYIVRVDFPDGSRGEAVVKRANLIHNLVHEGLHAVRAGRYNVGGYAPLEEERDAFNAGNEACRSLGLEESHDDPGTAYPGASSNPNYVPLE